MRAKFTPGMTATRSWLAAAVLSLAAMPAVAGYSVSKSFSPATIAPGETTTLTISIVNSPPPVQILDLDITDTYPDGMVNADTPTTHSDCGATATGNIGENSISLSNGAFSGNKICTITVLVTSNVVGSHTNVATMDIVYKKSGKTFSTTETPDATLIVMFPPSAAKSFSPGTINVGGSSSLSITISNPNTVAIDGMAFTDIFPSGMVLASLPALSNDCGGSVSSTSGSLSLSGGTLAGNSSCTVSVAVTSSIADTYLNQTGLITSDNAPDGSSASASLTVRPSVDAFNAVATGADPVTGHLYTRLAGQNFDFDLVALEGGSLATGFTGDVGVALVDNSAGGDCTSLPLIQALGTRSFNAGHAGTLPYSSANESRAWRNVMVRITYTDPDTSTAITSCSADAFAIRPQSMTLASSANADFTTDGGSGMPIIVAGSGFTLTTTTIDSYDGTPKLDPGKLEVPAIHAVSGSLTGAFPAATAGVSTDTWIYNEVGYFRLQAEAVYDDSFTAVDQPGGCTTGFSNSIDSNGLLGCNFGNSSASSYFGRFVPHHFTTTISTYGCNTFTYSGQPFVVHVEALNSLDQVTLNYEGGYARDVDLSNAGATAGFANNSIAAASFEAGEFTTPASGASVLSYTFADPETVPSVIIIRASESSGSDNVTSAGSASNEASTSIRSGRLRLINAFGSGQTALSLPLRLETWQTISGTTTDAWITETGDTCTAALLVPGVFSSVWTGSGTGTSIDTVTLYQSPDPNPGTGSLRLTAPGSAGNAEIAAELDDVAEWLRFDWDGDGDSDDPRARVGFELNPGNRKQIYTREVIGN